MSQCIIPGGSTTATVVVMDASGVLTNLDSDPTVTTVEGTANVSWENTSTGVYKITVDDTSETEGNDILIHFSGEMAADPVAVAIGICVSCESEYKNSIADHILKRGLCNSELSVCGDTLGSKTLWGVISLLTHKNLPSQGCGTSSLYVYSCVNPNNIIGEPIVFTTTTGQSCSSYYSSQSVNCGCS